MTYFDKSKRQISVGDYIVYSKSGNGSQIMLNFGKVKSLYNNSAGAPAGGGRALYEFAEIVIVARTRKAGGLVRSEKIKNILVIPESLIHSEHLLKLNKAYENLI